MTQPSEPKRALPAAGQTAGHLASKSRAQANARSARAKVPVKKLAAAAAAAGAAPKGKAAPSHKLAPKSEVLAGGKAAPPVPATRPAEKAKKPAKAAKVGKPPKLRGKPVRDSFTMPEADFALIGTLKARALAARRETKKSELLRAGLHALAAMESAALLAALGQLEPVKIGRPKKAS
jgi:hypothetical protein